MHFFRLSQVAIVTLMGLGLLSGCQQEVSEQQQEVIRPVKLFTVADPVQQQLRSFPAKVSATDEAEISFRIPGQIEQIKVKQGDEVARGQVLAYLDDRDVRNELQDRQASYELAINKVFEKKREHLSAIVLLSTLISISGSTFLGAMAAKKLDDLWLAIFTALLAYFMLVFAKVLPKLLAVQIAGDVVGRCAPMIHIIYTVTRPVLLLAMVWTRLLPKPVEQARNSDELRSIIRHYGKRGVIGKKQRKYAEAILTSDQKQLSQLVEHSQPVVCLDAGATVASVSTTLRTSPCKRYVVLQDSNPIGVVLYRHLARCMVNNDEHKSVGQLMRKTITLAPETTLHQAMKEVQEARASFILLPEATVEGTRIISAKMLYQAILH